MAKNKKERLFDYLKKQESGNSVSSDKLAKILDVTTRSIRYYVKQLNEEFPDAIKSNQKGYYYNQKIDKILSTNKGETVDSRRFSLLRYLLKNGDKGIDLFDMAENFHVSEATISADISALKKLAQKNQLTIVQHDFCYFLTGSIQAKRALMIQLICKTNSTDFSLDEEMQKFLDKISLTELTKICQQVFNKRNFQVNHYFLQNFILHLILILDEPNLIENNVTKTNSSPLIEDIANQLFAKYGILLSAKDKSELALLCEIEIHYHSSIEIKDYVDEKVAQSLESSLQELSNVFLIDFTDKDLVNRLLLHVQNLYTRVKAGKYIHNFDSSDIKVRYSALFDVAVYLSSLISKDLEIKIPEDEVAFLALHIGSFLSEQEKNTKKIRTQLIISDYLGNRKKVQKLLEEKFGDDLLLVLNDDTENAELLITTEKINHETNAEVAEITEFFTENDREIIQHAIEKIKQKRYSHFLAKLLPQLFQEDASLTLKSNLTKKDVFAVIGNWFYQHDFVTAHYAEELWEREEIASTVFASGVAIPHTIKYNAKKTGILIIKPDKSFVWDDQKVQLVFALAVSQSDYKDFNLFFPHMVEKLVDDYHVIYLKESPNRDIFIQRLIELLTAENYHAE